MPGVAHEQQQDVVLDGGQADGLPVHLHLLVVVVDGQAAALVDLLPRLLLVHVAQLGVAADVGLDPGHQLQGIEGLGDVVVGADV